jgi:putative phosphoesterase
LLVGLISDTHDNLPMVDRAIRKLNEENAELVLHAGDYVSPFTVLRLKELRARLIGVFGNNDGDHEFLKQIFSKNERSEIRGSFAKVPLEGLKLVLLHGSERELLEALIESQSFDLVVHGHSHNAEVSRRGRTLVVNPGEVCGYLSGRSTIALFDTVALQARIIEL